MASNFGSSGANPMGETLDFMKNLWGGMGMPGVSLPSFSVEDINKHIAHLKTVEHWLAMNMNMLKASIQALEVQSATLTTLQSMGQNLSAGMSETVEKAVDSAMHAAMNAAGSRASFNPMADGRDPEPADSDAARSTADSGPRPGDPSTRPAAFAGDFSFAAPTEDKPPAPLPDEPPVQEAAMEPPSAIPDLAAVAAPFVNPAAWWTLLQDQFKHAVEQAVEGAPGEPEARPQRGNGARKPAAGRTSAKAGAQSPSRTTKKSAAGKASTGAAGKAATKAATKDASAGTSAVKAKAAKGSATNTRSRKSASGSSTARKSTRKA